MKFVYPWMLAFVALVPVAGAVWVLCFLRGRKAVLRLPRGRKLTIKANAARENVYIRSCTFRGRPVDGARITHRSLLRGGTLKMQLDSIPPAL